MEDMQNMGTAAETAAETADNAAAAEVVAPQGETADESAEGTGTEQATEGNQPTEGSEKPKQSRGKNDHYAKLRRKADSYDSQSEGIMALARSKGLQPKDASEALEMLQADHKVQKQMQEDLAAIQAVDPSVKDLSSLEGYADLVERGITGVDAYYLLQGKKAAQAAAMPPSPGKVGGTDETGRDFTGEELDHLTSKDLDDPSILKKALASLRKLR